MVHVAQQQHSHLTPVHLISGRHVGKQAQPPHGHRRLATRARSISRDGHPLRPHTIDRFASALYTLLPRYNASWLNPSCEVVDALPLFDTHY
jgi:hypothetical protein